MTSHDDEVLVVGAGMAGLFAALSLAPTGRRILVLERDGPPPEGDADQAFETWHRRGVGHLRHSHAFLARLRTVIRDEHPQLLADLMAAGCREIGFSDMLTEQHKPAYRPEPEDADLVILTSRRTTLELVMRRYVERLPNVELRPGVWARRLLLEDGPPPKVRGVLAETAEGEVEIPATVVVDAAGRTSQLVEQLIEAGAAIEEESETAGILYFTRHYRLRPGASEPPRGKRPASGDLGYLKFGVFPGDGGCFSITIAVPEIEMELRQSIVRPETFDAVCREMPGLVPWLAPDVSEPVSKVFGMGDLHSRWREFAPRGEAAAYGFFPMGDALVRTNPLYGRGCSFAAVQAGLLRAALDETPFPGERLTTYARLIREELRPYYLDMRRQDRAAIRRARQALTPNHRSTLRSRMLKSFAEDGVAIAVRSDVALMRAAMRGFHMLEHPSAWLKRPENMAKVLRHWATPRAAKADAYPLKPGPARSELMAAVGLDASADLLPAA
ncbi:MAG TPA: FAD-dependent oxidoreductase [Phenylobacterium sp.]|nr:FAD-dependent oxidoreductase [Phenylobacterium sp.]